MAWQVVTGRGENKFVPDYDRAGNEVAPPTGDGWARGERMRQAGESGYRYTRPLPNAGFCARLGIKE